MTPFETVLIVKTADVLNVNFPPPMAVVDSAGGAPNGFCTEAALANKGSQFFVAFSSTATDLATGDTGTLDDIYIQAVVQAGGPSSSTRRFSVNSANQGAVGGPSLNPDLTDVVDYNGCVIVYESNATNLDPGDSNNLRDVFETLSPQGFFYRADLNVDGVVDTTDQVRLDDWLWRGGTVPESVDAADVDDDGVIGVSDQVNLADWLSFFHRQFRPARVLNLRRGSAVETTRRLTS